MKTIPMHIRVTTNQVATFSGRNIDSIQKVGEYLEIVRKRFRGGFYDKQFVPMSRVVSFSPGDGGKEGTAYATIYDQVLLKEIIGEGVILDETKGFVRIVDAKNTTHDVNLKSDIPNISVNLIQAKFKEIDIEDEPSSRKAIVPDRIKKLQRERSFKRDSDEDVNRKKIKTVIRGKRDLNF